MQSDPTYKCPVLPVVKYHRCSAAGKTDVDGVAGSHCFCTIAVILQL